MSPKQGNNFKLFGNTHEIVESYVRSILQTGY